MGQFLQKLTVVMFIVWQSQFVFAQHHNCGTHHNSEIEKTNLRKALTQNKFKRPSKGKLVANGITYIPIRLTILRKDDGSGAVSSDNVNEGIARLNRAYSPMNVQFYFSGADHNYINSTKHYNFDNANEQELINSSGNNNEAINVYFMDRVIVQGKDVGGYARFPSVNSFSNHIFIINRQVINGTWEHELGHYFSLYHTFQGSTSSTISNRELVTRAQGANCTIAGDEICDTPSDPFGLPDALYGKCLYLGTSKDANGDTFSPLVNNFMSYSFVYCSEMQYTDGQYQRLQQGIDLRLSYATRFNGYNIQGAPVTPQSPPQITNISNATISWDDNSEVETGYLIERSEFPDKDFIAIGGVGPNTTSYVDQNSNNSTSYYYRVRSSNDTQYSNVYSQVSTIDPIEDSNDIITIYVKRQDTQEIPKIHIWSQDNGIDSPVTDVTNWPMALPSVSSHADGWFKYEFQKVALYGVLFVYSDKQTQDFKYYSDDKYFLLDSNAGLLEVTDQIDNTLALQSFQKSIKEDKVRVIPNPSSDQFVLMMPLQGTQKVSTSIHSLDGKLVYQGTSLYTNEYSKSFKIDQLNINNGIYIITVQSPLFADTSKVIINR